MPKLRTGMRLRYAVLLLTMMRAQRATCADKPKTVLNTQQVLELKPSVGEGSWTSSDETFTLSWEVEWRASRRDGEMIDDQAGVIFRLGFKGKAWLGLGVSYQGRMMGSPAIVGLWPERGSPKALRYNLNGYDESLVNLVGDGTGDGWRRGEVGKGSGTNSSRGCVLERDDGWSTLEVPIHYTSECFSGHFAVCMDEPTHFIVTHGKDDGWKRGHARNAAFSIAVQLDPIPLFEDGFDEEPEARREQPPHLAPSATTPPAEQRASSGWRIGSIGPAVALGMAGALSAAGLVSITLLLSKRCQATLADQSSLRTPQGLNGHEALAASMSAGSMSK